MSRDNEHRNSPARSPHDYCTQCLIAKIRKKNIAETIKCKNARHELCSLSPSKHTRFLPIQHSGVNIFLILRRLRRRCLLESF